MKYLKKYEGIFDIFKDQDNGRKLDTDLLNDLISSDLDGLSFMGHDILSNISFSNRNFKSDKNGHPILSNDIWFGHKISYATSPGGIHPFGSNGTKGIVLTLDVKMDFRESFNFIFFIYNKLNYQRMNQYNIGYSIFEKNSILFYTI